MANSRRQFIGAAGIAATGLLAGCLGNEPAEVDEDALLEVPVTGDPDAEVTVTVFEDFGCGACGYFKTQIFPAVHERYIESERIRFEHRDFPIPASGDWSYPVASAARSVQAQEGNEAFFEFTSGVYQHQSNYSYDILEQLGDEVGADGSEVRTDAEEVAFEDGLDADRAHGENEGVESTPWIVVDGEQVDNSELPVLSAIDDALAEHE
ncbi:DsbA family protein [Natrialbaceae archaeon A-CW2]|uniref:DsbA family protein n=1 Tax=Natronosalvus amylolyticus TaxID=2961994 RepID=UPI0020C9E8A6|nr:thioredoxin domain-containing protein [Natronosalvus amylolyticus]